jgi:CheY-like chemotaxis protein
MTAALQKRKVARRSTGTRRTSLAGERVLAVDDDFDGREMLAALLEDAGAEVRTAASGAEALLAMRVWRPTMIVSDISMRGKNGYELIRAIRALPGGDRIPAAAFTSHSRPEDRLRALAAGFQAHIPKPVAADELLAVLARLARSARDAR